MVTGMASYLCAAVIDVGYHNCCIGCWRECLDEAQDFLFPAKELSLTRGAAARAGAYLIRSDGHRHHVTISRDSTA